MESNRKYGLPYTLWKLIESMGFPIHLINLIRKLHQDQRSTLRASGGGIRFSGTRIKDLGYAEEITLLLSTVAYYS